MNKIIMAFDLSSTCIGITFAQIDKHNRIVYGKTLPVIPEPFDPRTIGYTTKSPKNISSSGNTFKGFLKEDEFTISQALANKRVAEVKNLGHNYLLRNIGMQCGKFLSTIKPDAIAIERNKSFNGILTTKLLAEIAGGIYFYCGATGTEMYDWDESTVRSRIRKDIKDFSYENDEGKISIDTKWEIFCRLRSYFEMNHPGIFSFESITMDESDSLAVFYYYYKEVLGG